jgi:RNA polymerase sigma factor (sigma-70 family)
MAAPDLSPGVAALTERMAALDESAFVHFHQLYHERLFRYAFVLAGGHVDVAHDLVQETMLRVVRHVRPFDDESALWQWLTRLLRSTAADHGRKTSRWRKFVEKWVSFFRVTTEDDHTDDADDLAALLERALACIDASDAAILRSKYFEGTSVREIARQLETSEKAIESRLTRARQALRSQLERMNQQEQER